MLVGEWVGVQVTAREKKQLLCLITLYERTTTTIIPYCSTTLDLVQVNESIRQCPEQDEGY